MIRWRVVPLLAVVVAGATVGSVAAASAHEGGRLQIFLSKLRVVPGPESAEVRVLLIDADSADRATGYAVTLSGSHHTAGSFGPVDLDAESGGRYSGTMPSDPGRWTVTLDAKERPGTEPAVPLQERVSFDLVAGTPLDVVDRNPAGKQNLGKGLIALGAIGCGTLFVSLVVLPAVRRRRS